MRNRLVWISLLCLVTASAAQAATVRIPALAGGRAKVQLVDQAAQTPVIGFEGPEWATAYEGLSLDTAQTITLTPTEAIATVESRPTCYLITVTTTGAAAAFCVAVPDSQEIQDLASLAGVTSPESPPE